MSFWDALFPPRCLCCGETLAGEGPFCEDCGRGIRPIGHTACKRCGREAPYCACGGAAYAFSGEMALYYYDEIAPGIIRFKFQNHPEMAKGFAKHLAAGIRRRYEGIRFDAVTFAPMGKRHLRERGFNQAELLAGHVAKELGLPKLDVLRKTRHSERQHLQKGTAERIRNVDGLFRVVDPGLVRQKRLLWMDDVFTSGATANECSKVLLDAGGREVYCATIAITRNLTAMR